MADVTAVLDLRRLVGRWRLRAAGHTGRFSFFVADMFRGLGEWRTYLPRTFEQAIAIGYGSLFIVLLIAGFAGGVTALQTGYQFTGAYPLYIAGGVISESVVLELGPVLTEQIDALESLGRSPMSHLILPRCLAGLITIPALVMFANLIGFLVGWYAAKQSLGITNADFEYGARYFFKSFDLWYSAIKAIFFAAAVTVIPCYIGFNTQQGAEGVGKATTQAVVS